MLVSQTSARRGGWSPCLRLAVVSLFFILSVRVGLAATIEVTSDQLATINGRGHSIKTAIEELCWRAGVELRAYDASDRPFAIESSRLPLKDLLGRLLHQESFVLGYLTDLASGESYVAWLSVLGDHITARSRRREGEGSRVDRGFSIPPGVLRTAFASKTTQEREKALTSLSRQILGSPSQRRAFLDTEAALIAETLERYPDARGILEQLQKGQRDEAIKNKLAEVIAALNQRRWLGDDKP